MTKPQSGLELWAGAECTVVRVGDDYRDQAVETGHDARLPDLDLFADMGAKTVRFPILWERIAPDSLDRLDFSWTDSRLERLRELGIGVIGGLLHHGSGPRYTGLLDPDFPSKLAEFAARVAERYPWIERWTPVNEPLTTARFSGLYGHWYPHGRDYPTFLRALYNECRGTLEAMRAIRKAIPGAKLVQTEDLGKTFSTKPLRYQAAHENERRWLSLDLLCGRVTSKHAFHDILFGAGVGWGEMEAFEGGEATPDLLGINHYLTSERFLDHRLHLYPNHEVGGNRRDTYVDAEAVRVKRLQDDTGFGPRLREAWERYRLPIAITEVHHGCHRDEQLRWFAEVWSTAQQLRTEGVDLRAVTIWSMFGNVDWRFLLKERRGFYDTGAYDARNGTPRPTVIAKAARAVAHGQPFDHPALDMPGWWRRPPRLYPWSGSCKPMDGNGRKLLITGATGTLGQAFARACEERALPYHATTRSELDICDPGSVARAIAEHQPWAVINTAGFVRVADAQAERQACFAWNAEGAENLAGVCAKSGIKLVTFSSDLVFDGQLGRSYLEDDPVSPANVYGESKAEAERRVMAAQEDALVIRTAAFFGPWDRHNFAWAALAAVSEGRSFRASRTSFVSPTYVPDLCHASLDLLVDGETGLWHLANQGRMSWYDLAVRVVGEAGFDPALVEAEDGPVADNSLASRHGAQLRPVEDAVTHFVNAVRDQFKAPAMSVAAE
jgi:dTDP-4-dehydrorhamnose reductase